MDERWMRKWKTFPSLRAGERREKSRPIKRQQLQPERLDPSLQSFNQSINQRRSPLESSILPQPFTPTAHPPPPSSHSALPPPHRILTSSPTPFNSPPLPPLHPHPHPLHLVLPILPQPLNPTPMLPQDLKDLEVEVLGGGRRTHRAERRRGARGGAERRVKSQTDSADDDNWLQTSG